MKAKRRARRKWQSTFGCLFVLMAVPVALFRAWDVLCNVPTAVQLSQDYRQLVASSDRSEVTLLQLFHYGISEETTWRGTVNPVWLYEFGYTCISSSCKLTDAVIWMDVDDYPVCNFKRRIFASVIVIHISGINRDEPYIRFDQWRSEWLTKPDRRPTWEETSQDIAAIKEYVRNRIGIDEWDIHSTFYMDLRHDLEGWTVKVSSGRPRELIYRADVDHSEYQFIKDKRN